MGGLKVIARGAQAMWRTQMSAANDEFHKQSIFRLSSCHILIAGEQSTWWCIGHIPSTGKFAIRAIWVKMLMTSSYLDLTGTEETTSFICQARIDDFCRTSSHYQHLDDDVDIVDQKPTLQYAESSVLEYQEPHSEGFHAPSKSLGPTSQTTTQRPFLSGWRVGVIASLVGATLVCVINLAITIYVWTGPYQKAEGSIGTLFQGSCVRARRLNVWIHLIVNILSTLLLGASNYCMQVLSAPNRDELVRAHGKRTWLHIGVPSLRNLRHIGRPRAILWVFLALSSMPLHLLFNSVVFTNLQANEYFVNPVTEDWLHGGTYDTSRFLNVSASEISAIVAQVNAKDKNATFVDGKFVNSNNTKATYSQLDAAECFDRYSNQYMSDAGNVYIVHEDPIVWRNLNIWGPKFHLNNSFTWLNDSGGTQSTTGAAVPFFSEPDFYLSNGWRCPSHTVQSCDVDNTHEVPDNRTNWRPFEATIKYCMVEEVQERCKLQFNLLIAAIVVISNFIKAVCMALTLVVHGRHLPLVTLGDAIAHFLDNPDPETKGRCLFSRHLMEKQWTWELTRGAGKDELGVAPERFDPKRRAWRTAPSRYRWLATYIL